MIRVDIWTGRYSQEFSASHHMEETDPQLLLLILRELENGSLVNLLKADPCQAAVDFDNRLSGRA